MASGGMATGTTAIPRGTPIFSSDLTATSQNPFLSMQWKDRHVLGSTDGHIQLGTTRTETKPPTIVLETLCHAPGTPAPGHTLLEAEDAFGMHNSTPAHSCGHSSTELPREPKAVLQTHTGFLAHPQQGCQGCALRQDRRAGRKMEQYCCGHLATDHIHCR